MLPDTPSPEQKNAAALVEATAALALELPAAVYDDYEQKVAAVLADVATFDTRRRLHQREQRDSSLRLAQALEAAS